MATSDKYTIGHYINRIDNTKIDITQNAPLTSCKGTIEWLRRIDEDENSKVKLNNLSHAVLMIIEKQSKIIDSIRIRIWQNTYSKEIKDFEIYTNASSNDYINNQERVYKYEYEYTDIVEAITELIEQGKIVDAIMPNKITALEISNS